MIERRRGLTAEQRLAERRRDVARLRRSRLQRELAGPVWRRMMTITPVLFAREGDIVCRRLLAAPDSIIQALSANAVFALDTAMRLAHGFGFLSGGDVEAYLTSAEPVEQLAAAGLLDSAPHPDTVLVRPWSGPPRLLVCLVDELPPSRPVQGGHRVVSAERLGRELIGAVGARHDLFALLERAERPPTSP
ncbi:MAG TPA: hypothetical protein VLS89_05460 [Candidatus Nanopelagicales bacterium]|nr:hypothetical protein [Candidatus Nanopelagicales bacterium]